MCRLCAVDREAMTLPFDLANALRRFCAIRGRMVPDFAPFVAGQTGGGTVTFNGHPIVLREDVTGTFIMIHALHATSACGRPCFIVEIDTATGNAVLLNLEAGTCFTDGYSESGALVKVAAWIAAKRGARRMEFTDNSTITCRVTDVSGRVITEKVDLADLSFVTTGQTWYARWIPGLVPADPANAERLQQWRAAVATKKWSDVNLYLGLESTQWERNDRMGGDELASVVLTRMKKSGQWCRYFANNMDRIRGAFGIDSRLHGWVWTCSLCPFPAIGLPVPVAGKG